MRFIVGYTSTPAGRDALALGIRLASAAGARLDIVLVLASAERATLTPSDPGYDALLRETARGWLDEAAATAPAELTPTTHLVYAESFAEGLLEAADTLDAALLVVGAARDGLLGRFAVGSVAAALLHSSPIPVALAPAGSASRTGPVTRVTAAVGTRPGAAELQEVALAAVRRAHLPLRLVSLLALDHPSEHGRDDDTATADEAARAHAASLLAAAAAALPDDIRISTEVASGGRVEVAVAALDWDPDEIVLVGSSRLAAPRRLFLGATAAQMLRALPVPLVITPRGGDA